MGSGDEGQLGRETVALNQPGKVEIPFPMDMISAGEAHSCCANSVNGILYTWGVFRNLGGNMMKPVREPVRTGLHDLKGLKFKKLLSGNNHALILADKKIYVWGDSETCVLGRIPTEKRKIEQSLRIGGILVRNLIDVYTAGYHCFASAEKKDRKTNQTHRILLAWGKNNWGQLGIGTDESTIHPTEVTALRDMPIKNIVGGDDHTIFLLENGDVYACGRNDDCQLGTIDYDLIPPLPVKEEDLEDAKMPQQQYGMFKPLIANGTPAPVLNLNQVEKTDDKPAEEQKDQNGTF